MSRPVKLLTLNLETLNLELFETPATALQEDFITTGEYFFRWRSYLPLFMAVLFLPGLAYFRETLGNSPGPNLAWDAGCLAVALLGQAVRFFTVGFVPRGTSGRNTRGQVAETLNTTVHAIVRNPLYLGNFIIWFGLALFIKSLVVRRPHYPVLYGLL